MLRIGRAIYEGRQISHLLQLLVEPIQRPYVNSVVPFVQHLHCDGGTSVGDDNGVADVSEVSDTSPSMQSRCRRRKGTTSGNREIVRHRLTKSFAAGKHEHRCSDGMRSAYLITFASFTKHALARTLSDMENDLCARQCSRTLRIKRSCRAV